MTISAYVRDHPVLHWTRQHKWLLLLLGIVALLLVSPISEVYDEQDNIISPLAAILLLIVAFGTAEKNWITWPLVALTIFWLIVSIATDGSGLFAGKSMFAPGLFLFLVVTIFILLVRWLVHAVYIGPEVLCAAICGYLLVGVIWTGIYRFISHADPGALTLSSPEAWEKNNGDGIPPSDLLYFSFTTLTTTGFGDITPTNPLIRMVTVMEAIVGTFYNTIIIARFVGLYGLKRDSPPPS